MDGSDILIRLVLDCDKNDRVASRCHTHQVDSILSCDAINVLLELTEESRRVGVAVSAATPAIPLANAKSSALIAGLASKLKLEASAFRDSQYYADGIYCMTGHFFTRLLTKYIHPAYRNKDAATLMALELGLTSLARSYKLSIVEIGVGRQARSAAGPSDFAEYATQVVNQTAASHRPIEFRKQAYEGTRAPGSVQVIAYYLPQFHPIKENDSWWGVGFTEWHNVTKAAPRFVGHYQPHLPADLGYYDLRLPAVLKQQVDLARTYGIHGFCFYYYWFNGKRLLETPVDAYLADRSLDLPYCLCWANENWTRRWDGQDKEILAEQEHSARDDIRFIESVEKHMQDARYIRIDGKLVLLVYRADQFPDPAATAQRWRTHCRDSGIGEIFLVAVRSFGISDPRPLGFDAAVEFPPHGLTQPTINKEITPIDRNFAGNVFDYRDSVIQAAETRYQRAAKKPFPLIGGCMLSWDNDARRKGKGNIFHHSSPQAYANWLRLAALHGKRTGGPGSNFVFVNAWNEWAEGTHLEPDQRYGHAFLAATLETIRLFDAADDDLRADPPEDLGFASPALNLMPGPPIRPRSRLDVEQYRQRFTALGHRPSLRIVVAFHELDIGVFDTLYTLAEQLYRRFNLTVVTPDNFAPEWAQPGPAKLVKTSCLVSGMNQAALECEEEWIVFLERADQLFPHSLMVLAEQLAAHPAAALAYSDELLFDTGKQQHVAKLKPGIDRTLLAHTPYLGGLLAVRRDRFVDLGGFDVKTAGLEQYDLALRLLASAGPQPFHHVPEILVWRKITPADRQALSAAKQAQLQADLSMEYRKREASTQGQDRPLVSILIPTRNQPERLQKCIESLFAKTAYSRFEIVIVDHLNDAPNARIFIDGLATVAPDRVRIVPYDGEFNIAAINNQAAAAAQGQLLLFLNDDTVALHPEWLDVMVEEALRPGIGIVGCRLVFPDGRLQHAGVTLGLMGVADFQWTGAPMDTPGRNDDLQRPHEVGAVTGACLLARREVLETVGYFDEALSIAYSDFDLCIKARRAGWSTVYTPGSTLMHEAAATLKAVMIGEAAAKATAEFNVQKDLFFRRWRNEIARDPTYNRSLSLSSRTAEIEANPALIPDTVDWKAQPKVYGLPADEQGSGQYRVVMPLQTAHAAGRVRGRAAKGYPMPVVLERLEIDVIHSQRQVDDDHLEALARIRQLLPVKVVMDFDDLLTKVPEGSYHKNSIWPDIADRIRRVCALSHAVTVSTEPLAEEFRKLHDNVHVVPNGVDPRQWPSQVKKDAHRIKRRVGWAGGISHAGDLAVVREVVRALADEVEWVFFGMCLDDIRPHLTEFHKGVAFQHYPEKLAGLDLDLAIAPLEINPFNECKSNLRLLEYGVLGIPVIASDIVPYQTGLPVTLLRNKTDLWIRTIRDKVNAPLALAEEGAALRQAVLQEWTVERRIDQWLSAWNSTAAK
jgi:O-antigen biosynthesis protein